MTWPKIPNPIYITARVQNPYPIKTKTGDISYPIYDLTKNSKPYLYHG